MSGLNTLVLVGHPRHSESKLNAAMAEAWSLLDGVSVRWVGDDRLDVAAEQAAVSQADAVVFQYPLYWYGPPACLKRWMDEVLTWGWAFGPNGGLLGGRTVGCSITVGGKLADYEEFGKHGVTLESLAVPIQCMGAYVGMNWMGTFGMDPKGMAEFHEYNGLHLALKSWLDRGLSRG